MIQVRKQTFEDVLNDTPMLDLPVMFAGTMEQVSAFCYAQAGYLYKSSRKQLFGGYFYNKEECTCLLLT